MSTTANKFKYDHITTFSLDINPELATEMLARNMANNRTLKKGYVDALALAMKRGVFIETPQGIAFDVNGNLIDGQHRLRAIIKSGVTVRMRVTFGCPEKTVEFLDTGVKRNVADVATIRGSSVRKEVIPSINAIIEHRNMVFYNSLSNSEKMDICEANSNICDVFYYIALTSRLSLFSANKFAALLEAMIVTKDVQALVDFHHVYEYGKINADREYNNQMPILLRNKLTRDKMNGVRLDRKKEYNLIQNAFFNFATNAGATKLVNSADDRYQITDLSKLIFGEYDSDFEKYNVRRGELTIEGAAE